MGTVVPMSKVDGSWIWPDVYRSITPFRCGGCVSSLPGTSTPCQCVTLTSSDSLPAPVWLKHSYGLTPGGSLSTWHSLAPALLDPHQGVGLTPGGSLSLPGTVWLRHSSILTRVLASLQVALSLYLAQSGSGTPRSSPGVGLTPGGSLSLPGTVWLRHSSSPGCWPHALRVALSLPSIHLRQFLYPFPCT